MTSGVRPLLWLLRAAVRKGREGESWAPALNDFKLGIIDKRRETTWKALGLVSKARLKDSPILEEKKDSWGDQPRSAVRTAARAFGTWPRHNPNALGCRSAHGRAPCSSGLRAPGFRGHQHPKAEPRWEETRTDRGVWVPGALYPNAACSPGFWFLGSTCLPWGLGSVCLALDKKPQGSLAR